MKCLLDKQLSEKAKEIIADEKNEIYLSAASTWEIAIKTAKGRLVLPEEPAQYIANRINLHHFQVLAIQISHTVKVYDLPNHHTDPFDRLLVAQSQLESLPIVTKDRMINLYDVETIW